MVAVAFRKPGLRPIIVDTNLMLRSDPVLLRVFIIEPYVQHTATTPGPCSTAAAAVVAQILILGFERKLFSRACRNVEARPRKTTHDDEDVGLP